MSPGCDRQYEAEENWPIAGPENISGGQNFGLANSFLCEQVGLQLGFERATLETDSGTLVAINFYNKTGWTEVIRTEDPVFIGSEELSLVSSPVLDMKILYKSGI